MGHGNISDDRVKLLGLFAENFQRLAESFDALFKLPDLAAGKAQP